MPHGKAGAGAFRPGDFDVYLLAQTWAPHFCCHHADRCHTVPWAFSARHLSLHGLWPGFMTPRDGGQTFPQSCEAAQRLLPNFLPREYIDVAPSFTSYDTVARQAKVGELAKHEWKKHGTCTGLAPDQYFQAALTAMGQLPGDRGTPSLLSNAVGGEVSAASLRAAYAKRVAVRTDRQCRLSEVTTCFAKNADGTVGPQVDCPEHVLRGRDTSCASIKVTQLGMCLATDGQKGKKKGR